MENNKHSQEKYLEFSPRMKMERQKIFEKLLKFTVLNITWACVLGQQRCLKSPVPVFWEKAHCKDHSFPYHLAKALLFI